VESAYKKAWDLLTKHKQSLNDLAKALLEKEVLDGKEIQEILGIRKPGVNKKPRIKSRETLKDQRPSKEGEKLKLPDIRIATNEAGGN
jgi:hypothetical protein